MKKNYQATTLLLLIACCVTYAQSIKMELLDSQPFLQGTDTGDMEFVDLDGDGDMDLISTGSGQFSDGTPHGALTTLYFNDGVGHFTAVNNHGIEYIRASKIALADIDADGDYDLMISGQNGSIWLTKLYVNDGSGNFDEVVNSEFENLEGGYFNFGDIDGDSDQDIIFSGYDLPNVIAFRNDGSGIYSLVENIGVTNIAAGVLKLFDADGDNDLDIIITGFDQNNQESTRLYTNNGAGAYTIKSNASFNAFGFADIATGDTDGDGDLDVFISGDSGINIVSSFYINNGDGTFTLMEDDPFMDLGAGGETSFNDFDNDGDLDLFIIGSSEGGLPNIFSHIYENQGGNNFILSDQFIGAYLSTHAVADFNGDGFLDVVIGGTTTGNPVRGSFMYRNTSSSLSTSDVSFDVNTIFYPNPTEDIINISSNKAQLNQVEIYNVSGKLLSAIDLNTKTYALSILNYPSGIYVLRVLSENNEPITVKIIKK